MIFSEYPKTQQCLPLSPFITSINKLKDVRTTNLLTSEQSCKQISEPRITTQNRCSTMRLKDPKMVILVRRMVTKLIKTVQHQ